MQESAIQTKIIKWLRDNDFYVVKTVACNRNGVPDVLACRDGAFVAIEVKAPTGTVSKLQEYQIKKIKEAGGIAFVARSLDEVKTQIKDLV